MGKNAEAFMQHIIFIGVILAAATSPFDPSGYLGQKPVEAPAVETLTEHAIYRVNGLRLHRLGTAGGAIFLPGAGEVPELNVALGICEQHLRLVAKEILKVRDGLAIGPEIKKAAPDVIGLINKCRSGLVKSPVVTVERPDGAMVEIRAKEKEDRKKAAVDTRDDAFDEREDARITPPPSSR